MKGTWSFNYIFIIALMDYL